MYQIEVHAKRQVVSELTVDQSSEQTNMSAKVVRKGKRERLTLHLGAELEELGGPVRENRLGAPLGRLDHLRALVDGPDDLR